MSEKIELANNIRKFRKAAGYNMKQAASLLDVPYTTYVNYESRNTVYPSLDRLIDIARLYNISVGQLLGEDSESFPAVIFKNDDIKYLSSDERSTLQALSDKISDARVRDGKEPKPRIAFI